MASSSVSVGVWLSLNHYDDIARPDVTSGSSNRELAHPPGLAHTVQDSLKSIFAKTSAHNRRTVLSRALGT
jgi:hypothetical protein